MNKPIMYLTCCTETICQHIQTGGRQKDVAALYAAAIRSWKDGYDFPDWRSINQCIMDKWNYRALLRIKRMAHALLEEKKGRSQK